MNVKEQVFIINIVLFILFVIFVCSCDDTVLKNIEISKEHEEYVGENDDVDSIAGKNDDRDDRVVHDKEVFIDDSQC